MPKKRRTWRVVTIVPAGAGHPAVKAVREEEDGGPCDGCGRDRKTLYTYTDHETEPRVCSMRCRNRALLSLSGGARKPSPHQLRVTRTEQMQREAAATPTKKGTVLKLVRAS